LEEAVVVGDLLTEVGVQVHPRIHESDSAPCRADRRVTGMPEFPVADRRPTERTHHGDTFVDDYEWLRDKESPEVLAHLEAENAWTEARTAHLADLREAIFTEIKGRTLETDLSVPTRRGDWWYYGRTLEGKQYGLSCRCPVADPHDWLPPSISPDDTVPGEEVMLDANELAEGHDFFSMGASSVSPDGRLLAYSTDTTGDERFTLRVKDLTTGELLPDTVENVGYGATWDLDGTHLFYSTVDTAWRPDKVWRHRLGTEVSEDVVVHHESDERFWVGVGRTRSNRFLVLAVGSKVTSEYHLLDATDPTGEFRVVAPRRQGVEYSIEHAVVDGQDRLLVLHNDDALNFELCVAPIDATSHEEWEPLLAHDPAVRLEDVDAFAGHVVVSQRSDGLTQLRILQLTADGVASDELLSMEHTLYTVGMGGNPEFDQPTLRFGYTTMATPSSVHQVDLRTGERTLLKQTPVLGDFDPDAYTQHREWATAEDGTQVPISIVVPRGAPRDGSTPFVIYGYGSYEASMDPYFSIARLSLLDRGMGFAIAHVRGGGEMGRQWYDDGKMLRKRNTFTDFVACARHLAATGWTSPDRLVAEGGSAGGLLMGAAANLAPDAFAGILASVPFVDPLTSILDPSLPLTVIEWEEWGNPLEDPEVYAYMKDYSPYENVHGGRYPAILADTSLHDTRVLYVEPAKWVAKLRTVVDNPEDMLLKVEMSAGHGGVSGRYNAWRDRAFTYAWVLDQAGLA
jgi:oligopeptidase B